MAKKNKAVLYTEELGQQIRRRFTQFMDLDGPSHKLAQSLRSYKHGLGCGVDWSGSTKQSMAWAYALPATGKSISITDEQFEHLLKTFGSHMAKAIDPEVPDAIKGRSKVCETAEEIVAKRRLWGRGGTL